MKFTENVWKVLVIDGEAVVVAVPTKRRVRRVKSNRQPKTHWISNFQQKILSWTFKKKKINMIAIKLLPNCFAYVKDFRDNVMSHNLTTFWSIIGGKCTQK